MVSIVIPAYNAEKFILETLNSVYDQSYIDFEIIVVDDGSTDSTPQLVELEIAERSYLSLISKINEGVSIARNTGIEQAKGEYIAVLDADDTWTKDNLLEKVKFLDSHPSYDWVYSNLGCITESNDPLPPHANGRDDDILKNILLWEGEVVPGPCSNVIYRSKLNEKIKFDPQFSTAADQDFTIQLANLSRGKLIENRLVNYRILDNSMSRNINVMEVDHIGVYRKAKALGLFQSTLLRRKSFANMYKIMAGSWWKQGNNKLKGIKFIVKSILTYPPIVKKYFS